MSCQECSWRASPHPRECGPLLRRRLYRGRRRESAPSLQYRLPRRQTDCGQQVQPLPRYWPLRPWARQRRTSQGFSLPDTHESSILVSITPEIRGKGLDLRFCLVSSGAAGFISITAAIQGWETDLPKCMQRSGERNDVIRPPARHAHARNYDESIWPH